MIATKTYALTRMMNQNHFLQKIVKTKRDSKSYTEFFFNTFNVSKIKTLHNVTEHHFP